MLLLLLIFLQPDRLSLAIQLFLKFLHLFFELFEALGGADPCRRRKYLFWCNFTSTEIIVLYGLYWTVEIFQFFLKLALLPLSLCNLFALDQFIVLLCGSELGFILLFCHFELSLGDLTRIGFVQLPYRRVCHWCLLLSDLLFAHANNKMNIKMDGKGMIEMRIKIGDQYSVLDLLNLLTYSPSKAEKVSYYPGPGTNIRALSTCPLLKAVPKGLALVRLIISIFSGLYLESELNKS